MRIQRSEGRVRLDGRVRILQRDIKKERRRGVVRRDHVRRALREAEGVVRPLDRGVRVRASVYPHVARRAAALVKRLLRIVVLPAGQKTIKR